MKNDPIITVRPLFNRSKKRKMCLYCKFFDTVEAICEIFFKNTCGEHDFCNDFRVKVLTGYRYKGEQDNREERQFGKFEERKYILNKDNEDDL